MQIDASVGRSSVDDLSWDELVRRDPWGHHVQTSGWAKVLHRFGGETVRVTVSGPSGPDAGIQLRIVRGPGMGRVAVGIAGPVFGSGDPALRTEVVDAIVRWTREEGFAGAVVQPGSDDDALRRALTEGGFDRAALSPQLGATARLDLGPSMEELLAGMKSKTRYNARLALRKGAEVFEAGPEGPEALARLLRSTAERQRFSRPMGRAELEAIVSIMNHAPEAKIFLTRVRDTVVSGALLIGFGRTALYKRGAWNGEHGDAHPNEAMHVHMIGWAKERGYRTYDFDGMDEATARALLAGEDVAADGVTRFKLSFGSEPVLRPPTYARFRQPFAAANIFASRLPTLATRRLESWLRRRI